MDLLSKIDEVGQPATELQVTELLQMINEMAMSYGALVDTVDRLTKQNLSLAAKVSWLDEHVCFLLAKDTEYMEAAEKILKENAKEGTDDQGNSVSTSLSS